MAEELCTGWFRIVAGMHTSLSLSSPLCQLPLCECVRVHYCTATVCVAVLTSMCAFYSCVVFFISVRADVYMPLPNVPVTLLVVFGAAASQRGIVEGGPQCRSEQCPRGLLLSLKDPLVYLQ